MKSKEELEQLKQEYKILENKLSELSEDEIKQIVGAGDYDDIFKKEKGPGNYEFNFYDVSSDINKQKENLFKK